MKKRLLFTLSAGLLLPAFPAVAQGYADYHSGAATHEGNANKSAYEQMMQNIQSGNTLPDTNDPAYLRQNGGGHEYIGEVGVGQKSYHDRMAEESAQPSGNTGKARPLGSGRDVFVSEKKIRQQEQEQIDRMRGHDAYFRPVRD